ncbi:MAG: ABC transporter related protein [Candidatus Magasanikbacteria bacterium GW2011_GWC2_41_17]|uniref:ABC transporter related protein n=2 Tax=Candidatus Magasanikiibacteriota TaxID=1752731 RepID=A0A0G0WLK6_9BACT|nr:MAG: ABC transporter related protein [Candidatus Magasanikbacteria bacterium GW2011_GWC2_41_17]KKS13639.1 MAG: ABC transporter related protein [Candidatus Magasanikbacteria bacterium GW2011_GWA2_41_55]
MKFIFFGQKLFNLFSLFRKEYGQYKWSILLLSVLGFLGSILEGVGINAIIPIFSFVNKSSDRGADTISQMIAGFFNFFHLQYTLKTLLLFIIALFVIKAVLMYLTTYIAAQISTCYEKGVRSELFKLTAFSRWPHLSKQKIGHMEQILITDVNSSSNLLFSLSGGMLLAANLIIYILISVNISVFIALLTILVGVIIFLIFKPLFYANRMLSGRLEATYKDISHYVNENISGIKTIKAMAVESSIQKYADEYFERVRDLNLKTVAVRNFTNTALQPIGLVFIVGMFAFFYKMTAFNFASFAVIVYAINKVFNYIQMAQGQLHNINSMVPFVESIKKYREEARSESEADRGTKKFIFNDNLRFFDVSFSYDNTSPAVSRVNLLIKKGEMVGLIGPSGAGKTTVVDLLLRLFEPGDGKIMLDDQPINEISLKDWRKHIGYVSQDIFLMNDTIENNIKFYDETVKEEDMIVAAKMANIFDFIECQPQRFFTMIGERGVKLSGGERQRIILARILARHPEILVLDEATSALDNESEAAIQKAIENLKGEITVLVIAHRLSTIMNADRLLVIENGRIIEEGSPQKLLENKGSYYHRVYNIKN